MIKILDFKPQRDLRAGLKDPISFRLTELAPLDQRFKQVDGLERLPSKLSEKQSFYRLKPKDLEEEIKKTTQLFIASTDNLPQIIDGDTGLSVATKEEIRNEREIGHSNINIKRKEVSSLVIYRDTSNYLKLLNTIVAKENVGQDSISYQAILKDYFIDLGFAVKNIPLKEDNDTFIEAVLDIVGRIGYAKKGEVLDVEEYTTGNTILFSSSRSALARIIKFYKEDLVQIDTRILNSNDQYLSIIDSEDDIDEGLVYQIEDIQIIPDRIPIIIQGKDISQTEYLFDTQSLTISFNMYDPPTLLEVFNTIKDDPLITDYISLSFEYEDGYGDGYGDGYEDLISIPLEEEKKVLFVSNKVFPSISDRTYLGINKDLEFTGLLPIGSVIKYIARDDSQLTTPEVQIINGQIIEVHFRKSTPPTAVEVKNLIESDIVAQTLCTIAIVNGDGTANIYENVEESSIVIKRLDLINNIEWINNHQILSFIKHPNLVRIRETDFSSFLTEQDRLIIEGSKDYYAIPGVLMSRKKKTLSNELSLEEYIKRVDSEIPVTKIYKQVTESEEGLRYLGNLDLQSLNIVLYDNDQEIMLIDRGVASPGTSVQYKLHRAADLDLDIQVGDVEVVIGLSSLNTPLRIRGFQPQGIQSIPLQVNIEQGKVVKNEFIFNLQAKNKEGRIIDLFRYGTIRIGDAISFKTESNQLIGKYIIKEVDSAQNAIVLDKPLQTQLQSNAICEIEQTPLNPGRRYRISITCQDREGTS